MRKVGLTQGPRKAKQKSSHQRVKLLVTDLSWDFLLKQDWLKERKKKTVSDCRICICVLFVYVHV